MRQTDLIYNGQEAGNCKRLDFFERDPIEWQEHRNGEIYKKLFALKKANTALWNGRWGASYDRNRPRALSLPGKASF
jgi:hypothetical protein